MRIKLLSKFAVMASVSLVSIGAGAQQYEENVSVFDRSRPDYDANGIDVSSFKVLPTLGISESYDDNVFSTNINETGDFRTDIKPGLAIESNWNRHALNLSAEGDFGIYSEQQNDSYEDYRFAADGRLDVLRETSLYGGISFDDRHEDRGSPDAVASSVEPTEYTDLSANLGFFRGLHRFSVKVDGDVSSLDFEDGEQSNGAVIDNDDRDRVEYDARVRVGYEILPNYEAFVRGGYTVVDYDNLTGAANRDSDGYDVVAGTALNLGGKLRGEVYAGFVTRDYDGSNFADVGTAATYGAGLLWTITGLTSLEVNAGRDVEETTIAGASGYLSTYANARIEHELLRNLILGAGVTYSNFNYINSSREEDYYNAGLESRYLLTRNVSVRAAYDYSSRVSNISGQGFNRNMVTVGLSLAI